MEERADAIDQIIEKIKADSIANAIEAFNEGYALGKSIAEKTV